MLAADVSFELRRLNITARYSHSAWSEKLLLQDILVHTRDSGRAEVVRIHMFVSIRGLPVTSTLTFLHGTMQRIHLYDCSGIVHPTCPYFRRPLKRA